MRSRCRAVWCSRPPSSPTTSTRRRSACSSSGSTRSSAGCACPATRPVRRDAGRARRRRAPSLGEHTDEILAEIGLGDRSRRLARRRRRRIERGGAVPWQATHSQEVADADGSDARGSGGDRHRDRAGDGAQHRARARPRGRRRGARRSSPGAVRGGRRGSARPRTHRVGDAHRHRRRRPVRRVGRRDRRTLRRSRRVRAERSPSRRLEPGGRRRSRLVARDHGDQLLRRAQARPTRRAGDGRARRRSGRPR